MEFPTFNEEGKGNFFETYAAILAIHQDVKRIRQLLYRIIFTDPETKDVVAQALYPSRGTPHVSPVPIPIVTKAVDPRHSAGNALTPTPISAIVTTAAFEGPTGTGQTSPLAYDPSPRDDGQHPGDWRNDPIQATREAPWRQPRPDRGSRS